MSGGYLQINGVNVNKSDIKRTYKEGGKTFVELKNGVVIDIWKGMPQNGKPVIKIDKDNKTQIGNILCGGVTGTKGADDIVITNSRFMGDINLNDGDDNLVLNNTFTRNVSGGNGYDNVKFDKHSKLLGQADAEEITFTGDSNSHGRIKAKKVSFLDGATYYDKDSIIAEKIIEKGRFSNLFKD